MRILLAEDSAFYRTIFDAMLKEWGYEVWSGSDGEEAWQLLQLPDAPRLALIDWMMPRVDGLELCRRIRATPALKDMYVVMVTVKQDRESTLLAFQGGADDFIMKPFDFEELRAGSAWPHVWSRGRRAWPPESGKLEAGRTERGALTCHPEQQ